MATSRDTGLRLRGARCLEDEGAFGAPRDLLVAGGHVVDAASAAAREIDLAGASVLPALVNAHDVLDQAPLPPLGARAPYASVYEWVRDCEGEMAAHAAALSLPLADRLFLGGLRNLLAGVASVLHHHPDHRSLSRAGFPVRVQHRYGFAHSPGLTTELRRTYRSSDRRVPWVVRAAEGSEPSLREELGALARANVLRHNTVIAHATALEPSDAGTLAAARACVAWCPESDLRLYGRTAPALALRRGGVRVGLGSDGAAAGGRDLLSALASARSVAGLDPVEAVRLATRESAEVARLPAGGCHSGATADLLVTASLDALLAGDRRAVDLLLVNGRPVYGSYERMSAAVAGPVALEVEGRRMALEPAIGARARVLLRRHVLLHRTTWLAGVAISI